MCRRCVTPYPTRPTRPLEHSHCRAKPPRTVRVHCEHLLMWSQCTGRTRRSGRSVYTGNSPRTVRERYARRVKLSVCTRPHFRFIFYESNYSRWFECTIITHFLHRFRGILFQIKYVELLDYTNRAIEYPCAKIPPPSPITPSSFLCYPVSWRPNACLYTSMYVSCLSACMPDWLPLSPATPFLCPILST